MDHLAALPAELLLCIAAAHGNPLGLLLTAPPSKGLQASFAEALATLEHVCLGIELRGHIATLASAAAAVLDPVGVSAAVRVWLPDPLTRHGTYTGDAPRCRDALCIALLERCGRLRSLNLRGCRDLSAEHLFQSLSLRGGGASLTSLDLSGTRLLVCEREAQAVAAGCAQLTSLGLGRCTVSHGALAVVARGCQGLATLCFTDAEFCWRDTRRRYGKQSADNTRGAADAAVVELATTCTRLTSLGLGGADITDAAVVALASGDFSLSLSPSAAAAASAFFAAGGGASATTAAGRAAAADFALSLSPSAAAAAFAFYTAAASAAAATAFATAPAAAAAAAPVAAAVVRHYHYNALRQVQTARPRYPAEELRRVGPCEEGGPQRLSCLE